MRARGGPRPTNRARRAPSGAVIPPPPPYAPALNFSDQRNSQYAAGTMTVGVGVN